MKRLLYLILAIGLLTGCSELKVIGTAALKELKSEAINMEMASMKEPELIPEPAVKAPARPMMVAKAETASVSPARKTRKGAWERF